MEDQTRSGPGGGGSAMGGGSNPTQRDVPGTPGLGEQSGMSASTGSTMGDATTGYGDPSPGTTGHGLGPSSPADGLGLATTTDAGQPSSVGMRQQARDSVRDARALLKTQTREQVDRAKQGADRMITDRKDALTDTMSALTAAFDAAASSLSDGGQSRLAEWTRELSGKARRIATYLDEQDTRGLVTDLEGTARENPTAFIGTSFAAGLAAGRFLRASARPDGMGDTSALDESNELDFAFDADPALLDEATTDLFGASAGTEQTDFSDGARPVSDFGTADSSDGNGRREGGLS